LSIQKFRVKNIYIVIPAIILLVGALYYLSLASYILYHTLIELGAVVIAFTVFVIGWNTRRFSGNNMIIILATGFLVVGALDLLHTLSFRGIDIMPLAGSNTATQFWVAARYIQGAAFLLAAFYLARPEKISSGTWLTCFLAAGILLTYSIFAGFFPDSYIEGVGLTVFKIASEYIISLAIVAAGVIFWYKKEHLDRNILLFLLLAGAFTVLSEMSFTLYIDVAGFFNFLGHIFKLFAFAFIYLALVHGSLTNPFQFLFKEVAEANEKLSDNEKKYRNLVEQSTDWVWELDTAGNITYSNPRAAKLIGYRIGEIVSRQLYDFMEPEEAGKIRKLYSEFKDQPLPFFRFEHTMLHKDGYPVIFEANGTPVTDERGALTGCRGISRDITERKKAEQMLKQSRDKVDQANRAKSDFLARMSHEVRNPMNIIIGANEILSSSGLNPDQKEWVEMSREAAASLLAMIDDILEFSTVEAGKLPLVQTRFNLYREVEKTLSSFSRQAGEKGLKLSSSLSGDLPEVVMGDTIRLQQVLVELLENAIKYADHGEVAISLEPADPESGIGEKTAGSPFFRVKFSISDQGAGIAPGKLEQIFQSFSQVELAGKRKYEGAGLGLALSRKLVEQMGGSIGVESIENVGSTFYFTVPFLLPTGRRKAGELSSSAETAEVSGNGKVSGPETNGLKVLLVEDKPMNQKLAAHILESGGHRVIIAKNGREAVKLHRDQHFDLILMDIHMPEMDGLQAASRIRDAEEHSGKHIPIIAMTAYAMQEDQNKCLLAGMDHYVTKPIDTDELLNAMSMVMENRVELPDLPALSSESVRNMLQRVDGDSKLLTELMEMFFQDYVDDMEAVNESLLRRDASSLATAAHGLKGELGNLGMTGAYEIACKLEKLARENRLKEAASLPDLLESEIMRVKQYFSTPGWRDSI
jgi:PAS domain S-box-containing protein